MSFTQVCIHYVWTTKYRHPTLAQPYRRLLFEHIRQNALTKNIYIDRLNGYNDHVHCLVWLQGEQTIHNIAKLLKGESAYWFNKEMAHNADRLSWQNDYFAVSVSLQMVERVRAYIDRQEIHHSKTSFTVEYEKLMKQFLRVPGSGNGG